jgi:hypothetical protein
MVDEGKLRLVGPMVKSKVVLGRAFFTGPNFYYLLAILGIVFKWDVVLMTGFFTFFWAGMFALIFFWLRKRFGDLISLIIYGIISFLPFFIPYSRMMWNPHLLPFFGVLLLWSFEKRKKNYLFYLLAGLFFGLGLNAHYGALLWVFILIYYLFDDLRAKSFSFKSWFLVLGGIVLGELPIILFELRHNFYNLRTMLFQFQHLEFSSGYSLTHYHYYLFPLIPLLIKFYALFLEKLRKLFNLKLIIISQGVLIFYLLISSIIWGRLVAFRPDNWSLGKQKQVIDLILEDGEEIFEVATTINSDTRALELRWWLRLIDHQPLGPEAYNQAVVLYLVAPESRPPKKETVWEVESLRPFRIAKEIDIGDGYLFYKLRRLPHDQS